MRFDSAEFLFFFLLFFACYALVKRTRWLLIAGSYLFYASWNPPFLILLIFSTMLDFQIGKRLDVVQNPLRRKLLLFTSLAANLGLLAYFKYVNFFLITLVDVGLFTQAGIQPWLLDVEIPLGISFYTFQTISYTVDMYRRRTEVCHSFRDFSLFVAFFPQLIAGPIVRASEFIPQIQKRPKASAHDLFVGLELLLVGLFKKVVIADNFALLVDQIFARPGGFDGFSLLLGALAFSAQIYCDFSGYSTMARGLAQMLGFKLPKNFDYPLLATNPIEYRRGWHITMGTWFRDYLYRPLGGDRKGLPRALLNTMIVWTAFGFWHGASWPFLMWGFYNGLLVVGWRLLKGWNMLPGPGFIGTVGGRLVMPLFIVLATTFFRASSVSDANLMLVRMVTMAPGSDSVNIAWGLGLLAALLAHIASKRWYREGWSADLPTWPRIAHTLLLIGALFLFAGAGNPFYYFQF